GAPLRCQGTECVDQRDLRVELRVPNRHTRLVREDLGKLALQRVDKARTLGLEDDDPEAAFLVPQGEVEPALDLLGLEVAPESGDERALRLGGRVPAVGDSEALATTRRPGPPRREPAHRLGLAIDGLVPAA